jgi:hypothetical protein
MYEDMVLKSVWDSGAFIESQVRSEIFWLLEKYFSLCSCLTNKICEMD